MIAPLGQLDFIFFFYGLAFFMLASVAFLMRRRDPLGTVWTWLLLCALAHGLNEWLDLTAVFVPDAWWFQAVRWVVMVASFHCLLEFARRGFAHLGRPRLGGWVHLVVLCGAFSGGLGGMGGLAVTGRYAPGLLGGLSAAAFLWVYAGRHGTAKPNRLRAVAVLLAVYAFLSGAVVPRADFPPACRLHYASFQAAVGVPVQLLRGLCASAAALGLWSWRCASLKRQEALVGVPLLSRVGRPLVPLLLVGAVLGGWALTEALGRDEMSKVLTHGEDDTAEVAKGLQTFAELMRNRSRLLARNRSLVALLSTQEAAELAEANAVLDRFAGEPAGCVCYVMDAAGRTVASSNRHRPDSFVGKDYGFRSYFADAMREGQGLATALGVTSRRVGMYFAHAVRAGDGQPLGVAVVKVPLEAFRRCIGHPEQVYVLDENGVVLLAGEPKREFGFLRPVAEDTWQRLRRTGRYGPLLQRSSPLEGPTAGGRTVLVDGQPHVLFTRPIGIDGWDIAILQGVGRVRLARLVGIFAAMLFCASVLSVAVSVGSAHTWGWRMARAKSLYESLVEASPNVVALIDAKGRCLHLNRPGQDRLEVGDAYRPGMHVREIWGENGPAVERNVRQVLAANHQAEFELTWAQPGRFAACHCVIAPVSLAAGAADRAVLIGMDITDRKRAEQEVLRSRDEAQEANRQLADRARELDAARKAAVDMCKDLQAARSEAEAANRAKNQFLANVSDELRTPLNGIIGMTDVALEGAADREQRDHLGLVKVSADGLLRVVEDILDFSRIEAGRLSLECETIVVRDWLGQIVKAEGVRADARGVELVCRVDPDVPEAVVGDPARLRQILGNLLSNALKFTEDGEVLVEVRHVEADGDSALRFSVGDTGCGIAPENLEVIFEAFRQVDGSVTRRHGGTGLGLAICRQLAELMEGRLWAESEPGRGSAFHLEVPLAEDTAYRPKPVPIRLEGMGVLVVEDNRTQRETIVQVLRHWRMNPRAARSSGQAIERIGEACDAGEPFEVVLIDCDLPESDGFALARRIRSEPSLAGSIVMMLASAARTEQARQCRELSVAAVLTKPIRQSELLDAILTAVGEPVVEDDPARAAAAESGRAAPLRVLLAEDNPVNQRLASILLERRGHTVCAVTTGAAAVEAWEGGDCDLILMDVQMPEMDGLTATRRIRELEAEAGGGHVPIVAMTAHAMEGDRQRCLDAGMDGYVAKPIRPEALFRAIERLLLRRGEPVAPDNAAVTAEDSSAAAFAEAQEENEESPRIDFASAIRGVDGDVTLLHRMFELFLRDVETWADDLDEAESDGDLARIAAIAHALRGASEGIGALSVVRTADRLARSAETGDTETLSGQALTLRSRLAATAGEVGCWLSLHQRVGSGG